MTTLEEQIGDGTPETAPLPSRVHMLFAAFGTLGAATVGFVTSFEIVEWTAAQTTLVLTTGAAFFAFAAAVIAHVFPRTKKQPVAIAGAFTAFVSCTVSMGAGFSWWDVTEAQNAALGALITAIVAVASAVFARSAVKAEISGDFRPGRIAHSRDG